MKSVDRRAENFVGQTALMAHCGAALAAESGFPGALLHGIPGIGKTVSGTRT